MVYTTGSLGVGKSHRVSRLSIASPDLSGNEEAYVVDAIRSSWISSTGPYLQRFEAAFARACGTRHAIAVCNGTIALHLALLALDVRSADEVIVPSLTYVATANACRYVGAEPVFVDVDPTTWCISPERLESAITPRTKGIIAVHLYGHPADMATINQVAAAHGLWVIEDAAEAHFAEYRGKVVGGLGRIATFSFYGNKILTCGEGGALTLDDDQLASHLRMLRGQGMDPARRYYFPITGYNFRLTNVAAALLCAQLERKDALLTRRAAIVSQYRNQLDSIAGLQLQNPVGDVEVANWLMCALIDESRFGMDRDDLISELDRLDIETRPFFVPLHTLPPFCEAHARRRTRLPVTESLARCGLSLPTSTTMTDADVSRVANAIRSVYAGCRIKSDMPRQRMGAHG